MSRPSWRLISGQPTRNALGDHLVRGRQIVHFLQNLRVLPLRVRYLFGELLDLRVQQLDRLPLLLDQVVVALHLEHQLVLAPLERVEAQVLRVQPRLLHFLLLLWSVHREPRES